MSVASKAGTILTLAFVTKVPFGAVVTTLVSAPSTTPVSIFAKVPSGPAGIS